MLKLNLLSAAVRRALADERAGGAPPAARRTNEHAMLILKHAAPVTLETITKQLGDHGSAIQQFRTKVEGDLGVQKGLLDTVGTRLDKLEAKGDVHGDAPDTRSSVRLVETITKAVGFEALKDKGQNSSGRIALPGTFQSIRKALTSTQTGGSPNTGYDVLPQRADLIGEDPRRRLTLLETLPHLPVTSNVLEYQTLDNYVSSAGEQAGEGVSKSESTVPFTLQSARIATVAHWVKASRQVLDDAPLLQRYLNGLLSYGVSLKLENLIVAGPTSAMIVGLLQQAVVFVPTAAKAPDQISEAQAALAALGWNAGLVILHPTDWHKIRTERATAGDNQYVAGGWNQPAAPNVWGIPVVTTPAVTQGVAIVLDPVAVAILDRQQVSVMLGYENDDFTKNLVTILAEGRFGFATFSNGGVFRLQLAF